MPPSQRASGDTSGSGTRLGDVLAARRVRIDPRYKNRELFIAERGRGLSRSVFVGLETRGRANFEPATVIALELIYHLPPGWLEAALAGDIRPLPPPSPSSPPRDLVAALEGLAAADDETLEHVEQEIVTADLPPALRSMMWAAVRAVRRAREARNTEAS